MFKEEVENKVKEILFDLGFKGISSDRLLFEEGILDSMVLIDIMLEIEVVFGIQLVPQEVTKESFSSISSIAQFIINKKSL